MTSTHEQQQAAAHAAMARDLESAMDCGAEPETMPARLSECIAFTLLWVAAIIAGTIYLPTLIEWAMS
jgi:hypothetical protein